MKNTLLFVQDDLNIIGSDLDKAEWSAFPIGEEFGFWIPLAVILAVFFGFRYMAILIDKN